MHLAIWNTPSAAFLISGLTTSADTGSLEIEQCAPEQARDLLQRQLVDVALVPTLDVLRDPDLFDVLPGVALSTWTYPYARLVLRHGLGRVETVALDPRHRQEALVARIILREHYKQEPTFVPMEHVRLDALEEAGCDAGLIVGNDVPMLQTEHLTLNLGQEWYELVNYPMVWGLFAARADEATPAMVDQIVGMIEATEQQRSVWCQAQEMPPILHAFFADGLRIRLDDLALAGLTEFRQYLYFHNVTDDIPVLPLYDLPDDALDGETNDSLF